MKLKIKINWRERELINWVNPLNPRLMTLIIRPRYYHKKQIKTNYEAQFSTDSILNDKIKIKK